MEKFEHWACLPNNTVKLELTVEQARKLATNYETDDSDLSDKLGELVKYLEMRDKDEWCFVSMGTPYEESYPNGTNIGRYLEGTVDFKTNNLGITRKGEFVGYITRPKGGRGSTDEGWDVFIGVNDTKSYKAGWVGSNGDQTYTVKNPRQKDVQRVGLHHAIVTCYLRGVKEKK